MERKLLKTNKRCNVREEEESGRNSRASSVCSTAGESSTWEQKANVNVRRKRKTPNGKIGISRKDKEEETEIPGDSTAASSLEYARRERATLEEFLLDEANKEHNKEDPTPQQQWQDLKYQSCPRHHVKKTKTKLREREK
ncbi:hypothetical protein KM043_018866 [Ampulex compressa]|nr:hypothetical protein KM043_018866 [Ampulex compressa]